MADYIQYPPWNKPFAEQVAFFKKKLNLPSERWDDILKAAHDKAFMVAGAQGADLLHDLNGIVAKAIEKGTGLATFRKEFKAIVAKHGWSGWTGEGSKAGEAWRTKVIYQTNMSTSYAAGRWAQLKDPELLKVNPYWQYKHSDGLMYPRPKHVSWNGLTLPHDHVFWTTHFPPNGWGCHCRVISVNKSVYMEAIANGRGPANAPATDDIAGIDDGFAYAPGAGVDSNFRQLVQDKLITYPPAITKSLTRDINRYINATDTAPDFVRRALATPTLVETLWLGFIEDAAALSRTLGEDLTGYMVTMRSDAPRHVERSHGGDSGTQRPAEPKDYVHLIDVVNQPDTIIKGNDSGKFARVVLMKLIDGEMFRAAFEVQPGKRNKALTLVSLVIKTGK
ncbi:phage minor head protein [Undibacterium danionis]|uniref:Phage minor head protein n=1 Tax=Undibacterium danionis TaxID=1812100 RepID=A0ABV6ICZ7_9BURK